MVGTPIKKLSPFEIYFSFANCRDVPLYRRCWSFTVRGLRHKVILLCCLALIFAILNGVFMTNLSGQSPTFSFFGSPFELSTTSIKEGEPTQTRTLTLQDDPESRKIQIEATRAAREAVLKRGKWEACTTTFDRDKLSDSKKTLLLFSAPPPFKEFPDTLKSWDQALKERGQLVIMTNDPTTRRVCLENKIPIICVEHTDEGLPRIDKMFERMHNSQPDGIVAYVNSDLSIEDFDPMYGLLQYLLTAELELHHTTKVYEPFVPSGILSTFWFVVSTRIDIDAYGSRQEHTKGGYDFWAWNTKPNGPALLPYEIPPFRFPLATYDNWLLDVMIQTGVRNAIDASGTIEILHHEHQRVGKTSDWKQALDNGISGVYVNRYMAMKEPHMTLELLNKDSPYLDVQYILQHGTPMGCPYFVTKNPFSGQLDVLKRKFFSNVPEDDPWLKRCIGRQKCALRRLNRRKTEQAQADLAMLPFADGVRATSTVMATTQQHWRYTMQEVLRNHAREDGFVLLTAVNFAYRHHLMNFKCTLERVGMNDHFVIAAMDQKMYKWGILQGLPIFLANSALNNPKSSLWAGGKFGSDGFQQVTKLKSMAVLEVLNSGYSVVWTDVDIMWFVHPFDALAGFMKPDGGIAIQSNAPFKQTRKKSRPHRSVAFVNTDNPAGYRRLNSGLYVAPNNDLVKMAFQEIIEHAKHSKLTEQPSFDEILCARSPSERRYSSCTYRPAPPDVPTGIAGMLSEVLGSKQEVEVPPGSLHVELLDRFAFPNGAVLVGPNNKNVYVLGEKAFTRFTKTPLYAAHNNWIMGEDLKKKRAEDAGWWFADMKQSCTYHSSASLP